MDRPLRVVIFGSTGLIGRGVLLEALDHRAIGEVLTVGRRPSEVVHEKIRHLEHEDFLDFTAIAGELADLDACFWCLGISSAGVSEAEYTKITYDYTMAAAKVLAEASPGLVFCFVSGEGTDETERGRSMWARVKGRTENAVKRAFDDAYLFRPAYIRPMRGARSKTTLYRVLDPLLVGLSPLLRPMGMATSTVEIGKAMIAAVLGLSDERLLASKQINALAAKLDATPLPR
ncbi:MAG: epimerase [Sandaracinaceae bacterium]|nr:epimerase [Sandaracinaceae bacterium]